MTWTRLSDTFNTDPRLLECSRDARLLHVEALVYCNQHTTDGVLPYAALSRISDAPDVADAVDQLTRAGLWASIVGRNAWQLDWSDQEPAEDVEVRRALNRARQARFRDRQTRHNGGDHSACDPRRCNALRNASRNAGSNALVTPSRPVPSIQDRDGVGGASTNGTRAATDDATTLVGCDECGGSGYLDPTADVLVRCPRGCPPAAPNVDEVALAALQSLRQKRAASGGADEKRKATRGEPLPVTEGWATTYNRTHKKTS